MSLLNDKISGDMKRAMIARDAETLSVLRMLLSAIKNKMISAGQGGKIELSDEQIIETVQSEVKKRKDSIEAYLAGGRTELAEKEKAEIEILKAYLPEQLSEAELEAEIKTALSAMGELSQKDFGKAMGVLMPKFKGRADGNAVTAIVKKFLST